MNGSVGFFAVALATNLRYLPHHLAWHVTQMSTEAPEHSEAALEVGLLLWILRCGQPQVAGDTERFGGSLPASLCRIQPPASEHQRKNTHQSQEDYQPVSLAEVGQPSRSRCEWLDADSPGNLTVAHRQRHRVRRANFYQRGRFRQVHPPVSRLLDCLPDARNKTLRSRRVSRVFVAKLL